MGARSSGHSCVSFNQHDKSSHRWFWSRTTNTSHFCLSGERQSIPSCATLVASVSAPLKGAGASVYGVWKEVDLSRRGRVSGSGLSVVWRWSALGGRAPLVAETDDRADIDVTNCKRAAVGAWCDVHWLLYECRSMKSSLIVELQRLFHEQAFENFNGRVSK